MEGLPELHGLHSFQALDGATHPGPSLVAEGMELLSHQGVLLPGYKAADGCKPAPLDLTDLERVGVVEVLGRHQVGCCMHWTI